MKRMMIFRLIILTGLFFYLPLFSLAAPVITNFTVSPSSGSSGYPYSFTWNMQDAGGSSLLVPCADGIVAKDANSGTDISCGSEISSALASSDGKLLKIVNISGTSKTISVKLTPKDTSGVASEANSKSVSVTVSPSSQVIDYFKSSAVFAEKGKAITLSWNIPDAKGANISMTCSDFIRATSPEYTSGNLPCGKHIFVAALSKTGSITVNFTNTSINTASVSFTLFPAIGTNVYNGINTETVTLDVASDIIPDPVVNYFKTSSAATVLSGASVNLSWDTANTKGVNFKISCVDMLTATSSSEPAVLLPCDKYAFTETLPSIGNMTFAFHNKSSASRSVIVTMYPAFKDKDGYDATKSKSLTFEVKAEGAVLSSPTPTPTSVKNSPTPTPIPTPTPTPTAAAAKASPTPAPTQKPSTKPAPTSSVSQPPDTPEQSPPPVEPTPAATALPETKSAEKDGNGAPKNEEEISKDLVSKKLLDEVKKIELNSKDRHYDILGIRKARLFYLIPVNVKVRLKIDAVSGEVKETYFAWWSFLVNW